MPDEPSFGHWLRQRRRALDLTQEELAQQVGCASETIRKFEAGVRRPSKDIAQRLADALRLTPEEFRGGQNICTDGYGLAAPKLSQVACTRCH